MPRPKNPYHGLIVQAAREGLSGAAIARRYRIPRQTVQSLLRRARQRDPTIPRACNGRGKDHGNWNRMAVDQDVRALLEKLAAERRMSGSQLLNASLRVLLAEPVVLDNLLLVEEDA